LQIPGGKDKERRKSKTRLVEKKEAGKAWTEFGLEFVITFGAFHLQR
jgi:hypothetical protein